MLIAGDKGPKSAPSPKTFAGFPQRALQSILSFAGRHSVEEIEPIAFVEQLTVHLAVTRFRAFKRFSELHVYPFLSGCGNFS
jgi:hypothetical protein